MYPNVEAERARLGLTLEKIAEAMKERKMVGTITSWSLKLSGKVPITLDEARVLKEILNTDLPIEVLFEEAV